MASSTSSSKQRAAWLFACAAIVVLVFGSLSLTHPDAKHIQTRLAEEFWQNKVHAQKDDSMDVVISGDSRVYRGVSPKAMQPHLPDAKIINYGFSSGGHNPFMFKALDQLLADDGLRVVVLGITPYSLTPKAQLNEDYQSLLKKGPIPWDHDLQSIFRPLTIAKIKKMFRHKSQQPPNATSEYYEDGWVRSDYVTRNPQDALKSYENVFDGNMVSQTVINDLMHQTKTWREQGILVLGYRPPSTPAMVTLENAKSGFDEQAFRKAFAEAGGLWIELKGGFESYDGSHLTPESTEELSKILGSAIAQNRKQP